MVAAGSWSRALAGPGDGQCAHLLAQVPVTSCGLSGSWPALLIDAPSEPQGHMGPQLYIMESNWGP